MAATTRITTALWLYLLAWAALFTAALLSPATVARVLWLVIASVAVLLSLALAWRLVIIRAQLIERAERDPLTGLSSRTALYRRLDRLLDPAGSAGSHALILLNLDGFTDLDEGLGHDAADQVLVAVAQRMREAVPEDQLIARLGADEFAVLLARAGPELAETQARHLVRAVRHPYPGAGREVLVTASAGRVDFDAAGGYSDAEAVVRDARLALHAAKAAGKDQAVQFEPELSRAQHQHHRLSLGLRRALLDRELSLRYQPIVELRDERVVAVEALLRWFPPDGSLVPPAEFIPVAEQTGLIGTIGEWALRRACQQGWRWYAERGVAISVNVSGRQLRDPGFADVVLDALRAVALPGPALIIEITETALIGPGGTELANATLHRLREHGVRVALDDFGTGYSSLAYLHRLPVDLVKVDRAFVPDRSDPTGRGREFTRAILRLVAELGLPAVAEGVETVEQARQLRELGCPLAQGYLFAEPMPPAGIDELLLTAVSHTRT